MSRYANFPASNFMTDFEIVEIQNEITRQKEKEREIENERIRNNDIIRQQVEAIIDNAVIAKNLAHQGQVNILLPPPISPIPPTPIYSESEEEDEEDTEKKDNEEREDTL